jgi:hypothetical protein
MSSIIIDHDFDLLFYIVLIYLGVRPPQMNRGYLWLTLFLLEPGMISQEDASRFGKAKVQTCELYQCEFIDISFSYRVSKTYFTSSESAIPKMCWTEKAGFTHCQWGILPIAQPLRNVGRGMYCFSPLSTTTLYREMPMQLGLSR